MRNGDKYVGFFEHNSFNGHGTLSIKINTLEWESTHKHTEHTEHREYTTYTSIFKNNKLDGNTLCRYANGDIFAGFYKSGLKEGFGIITKYNNKTIEGFYTKNQLNGLVQIRNQNKTQNVVYSDNSMVTNFPKKFELDKEIGKGGHGFVYKALNKETDKDIVIKMCKNNNVSKNEIEMLRYIKNIGGNNNIVEIIETIEGNECDENERNNGFNYIIFDYMYNAVELFVHLNEKKIQKLENKMHICDQLLNAIEFLHKHEILHLDIKPENCIMTTDFKKVVLIDFGSAHFLRDASNIKMSVGSMLYNSPEINGLRNKIHGVASTASDVFSLGVLFYVLFNNQYPFALNKKTEVDYSNLYEFDDIIMYKDHNIYEYVERMLFLYPPDRIKLNDLRHVFKV